MGAGCFGKLPIHSDFIQHNADGSEIETLYKWFQEGMEKGRQKWGNSWESEYRNAPPTRFLFRESATSNLLVGVWITGADKEGSPHPFLLWTKIPQSLLENPHAILPLVIWDFLRRAEEVAVGGWNGVTLDTFQFRVNDLSCNLDFSSAASKYRIYLNRKMSHDLWPAIFGSFEDERKHLLLHNLTTLFGKEKKPSLPLRFPLAPAVIASFWVDLTLQIAKQKTLPTLTAWTSNSLSMIFPNLEANHFLPILRPDLANELGCDLARSGREDANLMAEATRKYSSLLNEPGVHLSTLLEQIIKETSSVPSEPMVPVQQESIPVPMEQVQLGANPLADPTPPSISEPELKPVSQPVPEPELKPVSQPVPEPVLKPTYVPPPQAGAPAMTESSPSEEGQDLHIAPRSEGLRRPARYTHGCYGKLPIFGDFIRDKNNLSEITSMDLWFQEGILAARQTNRNWDAEFTSAPPSRFLYASPDSRNLIAGVWIASVDRAGRRYPFLLYTIAPMAELGSHPQLYPLFFSDFFHRAQEIAEKGWQGGDLKSIGAKVDALSYHKDFDAGRTEYEKYLTQNKAGDLWQKLYGTTDTPSTMLLPMNLQSSLLPLRTGSSNGMKIALRFPRKKGVEPSLWIDLTMRMSGRTSHPTLISWTDETLTILYPNLAPKFYACLLQPKLQNESVADLARLGGDNTGTLQRARERFGAVAMKPDLTLGQLLRGMTGR